MNAQDIGIPGYKSQSVSSMQNYDLGTQRKIYICGCIQCLKRVSHQYIFSL